MEPIVIWLQSSNWKSLPHVLDCVISNDYLIIGKKKFAELKQKSMMVKIFYTLKQS
jgi:hypothetical protein